MASLDSQVHDPASGRLVGITIEQLSIGEQLVIWAFRNRLAGAHDALLVRGFHLAFGLSMMEAALAAFDSLAKAIVDHGRRPLAVHAPLCRCVSSDEMMLACLIAASQAGHGAATTAISRYLVRDPASDQLSAGAASLGLLLERQRMRLPLRPLLSLSAADPGRLH